VGDQKGEGEGMSSGICPFAIQLPGPEWKTSGTIEKCGVTLHSAEYDLPEDEKVLYNVLHSSRKASWPFTITRPSWNFPSLIFQHYALDAWCWHAGPGNPWTHGVELEGIAPQRCEGGQYDNLVRLLKWIREAENWGPQYRRSTLDSKNVCGGLYEHQQWMATNCAVFTNKQVDGDKLIHDLKEEPMPEFIKEQEERIKAIHAYAGPDLETAARLAVSAKAQMFIGHVLLGDWPKAQAQHLLVQQAMRNWHRWKE